MSESRAAVEVTEVDVKSVLTRTTGYLRTVTSHSLQPYRGCAYGNALCGEGCYVRHNPWIARGRPWGSFLEVKRNAAAIYRAQVHRERAWARRARGGFGIFLASSTDPFVPQERRHGVTRGVLTAMLEPDDAGAPGLAPDLLIVQSHSHLVGSCVEHYRALSAICTVRVHISIESDRERLPGLPPPASSVERRFAAAAALRAAGVTVAITVAPLLPIARPREFFARIADVADAVVIDHFIDGDGSAAGARTRRTRLPQAMAQVAPESVTLAYRDRMIAIAARAMSGRVGVGIDGFAGRYLARGVTAATR